MRRARIKRHKTKIRKRLPFVEQLESRCLLNADFGTIDRVDVDSSQNRKHDHPRESNLFDTGRSDKNDSLSKKTRNEHKGDHKHRQRERRDDGRQQQQIGRSESANELSRVDNTRPTVVLAAQSTIDPDQTFVPLAALTSSFPTLVSGTGPATPDTFVRSPSEPTQTVSIRLESEQSDPALPQAEGVSPNDSRDDATSFEQDDSNTDTSILNKDSKSDVFDVAPRELDSTSALDKDASRSNAPNADLTQGQALLQWLHEIGEQREAVDKLEQDLRDLQLKLERSEEAQRETQSNRSAGDRAAEVKGTAIHQSWLQGAAASLMIDDAGRSHALAFANSSIVHTAGAHESWRLGIGFIQSIEFATTWEHLPDAGLVADYGVFLANTLPDLPSDQSRSSVDRSMWRPVTVFVCAVGLLGYGYRRKLRVEDEIHASDLIS